MQAPFIFQYDLMHCNAGANYASSGASQTVGNHIHAEEAVSANHKVTACMILLQFHEYDE